MPPKKVQASESTRRTLRSTKKNGGQPVSDSPGASTTTRSPQNAGTAPPPAPPPPEPLTVDPDVFSDGVPASRGQQELATAAAVLVSRLETEPYPKGSQHAEVLKKLYSQVLAAQDLGHRTCHALWGPKHSGKKTVLTHLSRSLRSIDGLVVVELDAELHRNDSDALRQIGSELTKFLESSSSQALRRKSHHYRDKDPHALVQDRLFGRNPVDEHGHYVNNDANASSVNIGGGFSVPQVDIGALNNLQTFLVDLNQRNVSMAFLISDFGRFALWCDRVAYILSALMHECDRRVGGVSLVLTTEHFDVGLEKRLASRLTPEMWFLAPMPLAAGGVFMMTLRVSFNEKRREYLELVRQLEAAETKAKDRKKEEGKKAKAARDAEQRRISKMQSDIKQRESILQDMHDAHNKIHDEMKNPNNVLHRMFIVAEQKARLSGLNTSMTKALLFNALNLLAVRDVSSLVVAQCNIKHHASPFELLSTPEVFVERGYASREAVFIIFFLYIRQQDNVERTLSNILDEITLAFPSVEAKAGAWKYEKALSQLIRWDILSISSAGKLQLLGPPQLYRNLLHSIFHGKVAGNGSTYANIVCIDTDETHQLSNLLR